MAAVVVMDVSNVLHHGTLRWRIDVEFGLVAYWAPDLGHGGGSVQELLRVPGLERWSFARFYGAARQRDIERVEEKHLLQAMVSIVASEFPNMTKGYEGSKQRELYVPSRLVTKERGISGYAAKEIH